MRRIVLISAILSILFFPISTNANIIHVPADYNLIQDAINISSNGDTVLVARGSYTGSISFNGHSIVLASNYLLSQDTSDISATILSGAASTDTVVKIINNELDNTILCGFNISRGHLGVFVKNASPKILNNKIWNIINQAYWKGGGILWIGGSVSIIGNEIRRNSAGYGAGIWVEHSTGVIHHNILADNHASIGSAIVLNNTGTFEVYNNTFYRNFPIGELESYGALVVDSINSRCYIFNNIFALNDFGLGHIGGPAPTNTYNDYYSNSRGDFYDCFQGTGEILLNPEFTGGSPFDLTLHETSPCVNSGNPASPLDPDGSRADMGAIWPPYPVPRGLLGGTVVNETGSPIPNVRVYGVDFTGCDTTDANGRFSFGMQPNDSTFSLLFLHHDYIDTTINNYRVIENDTTGMQIAFIDGIPRGALKGHITDSVYGMPVNNVVVQIGNSGNTCHSDTSGNYFINKLTPGIYDLYFSRQSYDTLIVHNFEIVSEDTLTLDPQLVVSNFGYFLTYGNKDATPTPAVIGAELEIPAWGKASPANSVDSITYMHNPLSSNDSIITAHLGVYLPDFYVGRWDLIDTLPPSIDPNHLGYTNHSLAAFAWIIDPPDPENYFVTGNDTVLVSVYRMMVANNPALLGDTLTPFCEGYHPAYGPLMWGMNDGITPIFPVCRYPSLYFIEQSQVGYLNAITNDSASIPLAHVYTSVNNSHKCGFTDESGNHSFGWLLPGTYSVNFQKDRYWDTTITDIIVAAGETTDVIVDMATYPAYGGIFGQITDNTFMPVIGAIVNVNGVGIADTTDENGYYSFDSLATGYHELHVSHVRHTDTTFIDAVPYYDSSEVNVIMRVLPPITIHVPDDFGSVNTAVDMAVYGDTILISPGLYHDNIRRFKKELQMIGRGGRDSTTIQANLSGVSIIAMSGNLQESCLDGITFTGSVNVPAITISGTGCTIRNCAFIGNHSGNGGAINAWGGEQLYLFGNNFTDNISSGGGGAVDATDITLWAVGNIFKNNIAAGLGGAISYWDSEYFYFEQNLFAGNSSHGLGSAIEFRGCRYGDFYNNTMAFNDSHSQSGCCIYILLSYFITVANNIISHNTGGGVGAEANWQGPSLVYNDVWSNTPDYYNNATPGSGSISEDPSFEGGDPFSYQLTAISPCIDSGDPEGLPDPDGTRTDIGAFYFYHEFNQCPYILGDINGSGTPNGIDVTYGVRYFKGGPVPPNTCDNCPEPSPFFAAGDVNGSCSFNGIDISYMVSYLKGGSALHACPECPPGGGARQQYEIIPNESSPAILKMRGNSGK